MQEQKVMYDSDEAATYKTGISGWVSRHGTFFSEEHMARYNGCTHRTCACGSETDKHYSHCSSCREKHRHERYRAMPAKQWDETGMLYSDSHECYFNDWSEVEDYCHEHEITDEALDLIICKPQYLSEIDADHWEDVMPEDWGYHELPETVQAALDTLNKALKEAGPISWYPGKFAAEL